MDKIKTVLEQALKNKKWSWNLQDHLGLKKDGSTTPKWSKIYSEADDGIRTLMDEVQLMVTNLEGTPEEVIKEKKFFEGDEHIVAKKLFKAGFNLYFFGEAGCGKTTFAIYLAEPNYYLVSCSNDMVPSHLIGHFELQGEETVFVYGPLVRAMADGKVLVLDEFDRVNEDVAAKLHEVLQSRKILVEQTNEVIEAQEGFQIIATGNSDMFGSSSYNTTALDAATIDRFEFVEFKYSKKELDIYVQAGADEELAGVLVEFGRILRSEASQFPVFSIRRGLSIVRMIKELGFPLPKAIEFGYASRLSPDDRKTVNKILKSLTTKNEAEVWVLKNLPHTLEDQLKEELSSSEFNLYKRTRTVLATENLLKEKPTFQPYIEEVKGGNPTGVTPEELVGDNN